jgi:hypothetical protein
MVAKEDPESGDAHSRAKVSLGTTTSHGSQDREARGDPVRCCPPRAETRAAGGSDGDPLVTRKSAIRACHVLLGQPGEHAGDLGRSRPRGTQ